MIDLHLGRSGLTELDPTTGVRLNRKGACDDDACRAIAVLHRSQLGREYVVASIATVMTTTTRVIISPRRPELVPLVPRHLRPYGDDADLAKFGSDQPGRTSPWLNGDGSAGGRGSWRCARLGRVSSRYRKGAPRSQEAEHDQGSREDAHHATLSTADVPPALRHGPSPSQLLRTALAAPSMVRRHVSTSAGEVAQRGRWPRSPRRASLWLRGPAVQRGLLPLPWTHRGNPLRSW